MTTSGISARARLPACSHVQILEPLIHCGLCVAKDCDCQASDGCNGIVVNATQKSVQCSNHESCAARF